jgi:hypothetical protein
MIDGCVYADFSGEWTNNTVHDPYSIKSYQAMSLPMPPAHYYGHPYYKLKLRCLLQKWKIFHYHNHYEIFP